MIRPEYTSVRLSINKCRDAIENSLSRDQCIKLVCPQQTAREAFNEFLPTSSETRFGKNEPLWPNFKVFGTFREFV